MSEYQYYEFRALERRLTEAEQDELREFSSRAEISSKSFIVEYNYSDFRGDEDQWMMRYFDAFLYVANWGSHVLKFALPAESFSPETLVR